MAGKLYRKPDVTMNVIGPAGYLILRAAKETAAIMNRDLMITSGNDGVHSGPKDPHYTGEAYDFRSNDMTDEEKSTFVSSMNNILGPEFFTFLESPGTQNEHFHSQRTKGTVYSVGQFLQAL